MVFAESSQFGFQVLHTLVEAGHLVVSWPETTIHKAFVWHGVAAFPLHWSHMAKGGKIRKVNKEKLTA